MGERKLIQKEDLDRFLVFVVFIIFLIGNGNPSKKIKIPHLGGWGSGPSHFPHFVFKEKN